VYDLIKTHRGEIKGEDEEGPVTMLPSEL